MTIYGHLYLAKRKTPRMMLCVGFFIAISAKIPSKMGLVAYKVRMLMKNITDEAIEKMENYIQSSPEQLPDGSYVDLWSRLKSEIVSMEFDTVLDWNRIYDHFRFKKDDGDRLIYVIHRLHDETSR